MHGTFCSGSEGIQPRNLSHDHTVSFARDLFRHAWIIGALHTDLHIGNPSLDQASH